MNTILDKPFVPHQSDLVSIVKFDDTFSESRSNEFLNSLYVTLETLEICNVDAIFLHVYHKLSSFKERINSFTIYHDYSNINLSSLLYKFKTLQNLGRKTQNS